MLVVKAVPLNREMPLRDTQNTNRTSKLDFVFVDVGADLVFFRYVPLYALSVSS